MSNSPTRKKLSNLSVPGESRIRKGLVKMDMSELEKVIQDLYDQNQILRDKIDTLEIVLNRDDQLMLLKQNIDETTEKGREHTVSIGNIQAKLIDVEKKFLKMDQRTKGVETEIKVARNAEKDTKSALKREVKLINAKIFEAEKRLPDIAKQFTKPIEEKLLLAYSCIDELEGQVDEVEERVNDLEVVNGGSKRREDSESEDAEGEDDEENNDLKIDMPGGDSLKPEDAQENPDLTQDNQSAKGKKSKGRKRARRRKSLK